MSNRIAPLMTLAAIALFSTATLSDEHDVADHTANDEPRLHTVAQEDLALSATITGRLEAAITHRLRLLPEAYTGPFPVDRIDVYSGLVNKGDVILRIDATRIDESIQTSARQLIDQTQRRSFTSEELPVLEERSVTQLKQHEIALARALTELDLWNSYRGPAMLKNAELSVRSMENFVSNQREELQQLEQMYEGTELDSETKEIVLERARRSLEIAEERLMLTRNDHHITTEFTHPHRTEDVHNDVQYREEALAHLRINTAIALARKQAEIESLEISIDETQRRLRRLNDDREQFELRAPASGLMTRIDLEPGDTVNARQVIATIHDPSSKVLRIDLAAADLRIVREGDTIDLRVPEYPEISLTGTVESISPLGRARGDETVFDAEIHVQSDDPLLRLGLRVTGRAERTMENVLVVPRTAVTERDGQHVVTVDVDGEHEERAVTVGAGNDDSVQVVSGLSAGDHVVLPTEE